MWVSGILIREEWVERLCPYQMSNRKEISDQKWSINLIFISTYLGRCVGGGGGREMTTLTDRGQKRYGLLL